MEGFRPQKYWILTGNNQPVIDKRSGGILLFTAPDIAGKAADKERAYNKKSGRNIKVRVKGVMILSEVSK